MFSFSTIYHFLDYICSKLLLYYLDFHMNENTAYFSARISNLQFRANSRTAEAIFAKFWKCSLSTVLPLPKA